MTTLDYTKWGNDDKAWKLTEWGGSPASDDVTFAVDEDQVTVTIGNQEPDIFTGETGGKASNLSAEITSSKGEDNKFVLHCQPKTMLVYQRKPSDRRARGRGRRRTPRGPVGPSDFTAKPTASYAAASWRAKQQ